MSLKQFLENHIKNDEEGSKKGFQEYLKEKVKDMLFEKSNAYDVFLKGKLVDTVFDEATKAEDVKKSLIDHDGYDDDIVVKKCVGKKKLKEDVDFFPNKVDVGNINTKPSGKDTPSKSKVDYVPNVAVDKLKPKGETKPSGSKTDYFPNKVDVNKMNDGKKGSNEGGSSQTNYFPNDLNVPEYSFEDTFHNLVKHFGKYQKAAGELYSKGAGSSEWHGFVAKVAKDHNLKYTPEEAKSLANKIHQNKGLPETSPLSSLHNSGFSQETTVGKLKK